jgi:hypothetical protein
MLTSTAQLRRFPPVVNNRGRRTLLLATLATITLVWAAIYNFDVPVEEMAWLALYSAAGVFTIIFLAALAVAVVQGLKWLLSRARGQNQGADSS